ncbi:HR-like lesion-inducing protein-related [Euphorbia peplus]|nr:HR-like lesion-inducing protein-related [Euphorbia peplus]
MGFTSFLGRLLFASLFILSAYQEFNEYGVDGGPAAKTLKPKYGVVRSHVKSYCGVEVPEIEMKDVVAAAIALKGVGGILFISGSSLGAFLLILHQMIFTPVLHDFYNYDNEEKEFNQLFIKFTQNMALFGALLFFLGMKNSVHRRHQKKKATATKTKTKTY